MRGQTTPLGRSTPWLALLGGALLIAAACGGGDDDDDGGAGDASASTATPAATAAPTGTAAAPGGKLEAPIPPPAAVFAGEGLLEGADLDWRVTRVDQGTKPDLAFGADGAPLVAYMLERRGAAGFLRVAALEGGAFAPELVQDGYLYGPLDLEVGPDGTVAVAYHNHDWEDAAVGVLGADGWRVERIESAGHDGWDDSLAFGPDGRLHLLNVDPSQFNSDEGIEYSRLEDGVWRTAAVGSGPQPYEWGTDIAVDAAGVVHVVYFDAGARDLVYGRFDGAAGLDARNPRGAWTLEPIYEQGDAGRFAALALDEAGTPHVAFVQIDPTQPGDGRVPGRVVYGTLGEDGWSFEPVVRLPDQVLGFEDARRSVAIAVAGGEPVVAFIDSGRVGYARPGTGGGGAGWAPVTIAEAGDDPFQIVGMALDEAGRPHFTFSTITGNGPLDGEVWYVEPVAKGAG